MTNLTVTIKPTDQPHTALKVIRAKSKLKSWKMDQLKELSLYTTILFHIKVEFTLILQEANSEVMPLESWDGEQKTVLHTGL